MPICGQTTLGSGQTKALLDKPEYWAKVYPNNFRPVCYGAERQPSRAHQGLRRPPARAKVDMSDTLLWWIALGYDTPYLIAEAIKNSGPEPEKIVAYWNKLKDYPGVYGDISFTPDEHNGYPGPADRDGRSQLAQGRRVQPRSRLRRLLSRWSNRLFCPDWRSAASTH